jgi:DNA-binding response OmpR family regulator
MKRLLIIDDDIAFCDMLRDYLASHDIALHAFHDGTSGLAELRTNRYELLLLDVMLPDMDGYEVLSRLRAFSCINTLMLSTLGNDTDRITGLDLGADDYLPKPFNPRELVSRITAILRRSNAERLGPVPSPWAGLSINRNAREAYYRGNRIPLTEVEFSLLAIFLETPDTVLEREDLVARVFQRPFNPLDRSLDMHISRLRRKLSVVEGFADPIKTIRSSGYLYSPRFASPS